MVELTARSLPMPAVRKTLANSLTFAGIAAGLAACAAVGALGFANGGYFPVSWGWAGVGLLALMAIALAVGVSVELDVLDRLFLGALAGLAAWIGLSLLWTGSVPRTVFENERMVVYLAGAVAGVVLVRRSSVPMLLIGVWVGSAVVSTYALATRLLPDRLGHFDPVSSYRLSWPVGYWNALGLLAAMGALLALGLAARSGPVVRCLAAGTTVIFMLTLYFTYSRGGWIAFFLGLAAAVALDGRRLQLITTALVLAPWPVIAVWVASTSPALTHADSAEAAATRDGHGLAVIAIILVVAAALAILAQDWLETAVSVPRGLRRAYAGTLLFVLAALLIVVFGRYGFPPTLARKAYNAFNSSVPGEPTNLNSRLFSLSGNGRTEQFHTAWQQVTAHPVLGGGAGTYDEFWFQHRRVAETVHDAHSLYLETLAELGPVGLALLVLALGVPLVAVRRARSSPLAAVACAAYVAYLAHAAIDWDWEMPALTLAALFCGIALLAAARREDDPRSLGRPVRLTALGGTAALLGFVVLGLLGNSAVSASSKATTAANYKQAIADARRAVDFAPWSSEPWRRQGEAQANLGQYAAARASFRKAITKDPRDWTLWYELAVASEGRGRELALAAASRLNPLSPEIAAARREGTG
jgi:tetratricopeptide (TPR) repeat protein